MPSKIPSLRAAAVGEAIGHALGEARSCFGHSEYCAGLAMLRKAVDLWSAAYRDEHGMTFDRTANERDNLYWRLQKIAEANPLYKSTVHEIVDGLRISANEAVHDPVVCFWGTTGTFEVSARVLRDEPYDYLHSTISKLVTIGIS